MKELEFVKGVDRLLSVEEAAAYLGIQPNTVHNWSMKKNRKLPVCKIGRLNKYRLSDLTDFITSNMLLPADKNTSHVSV